MVLIPKHYYFAEQMLNKYTKSMSGDTIPQTGVKSKKSVKLSPEELKKLKQLRRESESDTAFASDMDVDRVSLIRIILTGSGSEANIKTISRKLSKIA